MVEYGISQSGYWECSAAIGFICHGGSLEETIKTWKNQVERKEALKKEFFKVGLPFTYESKKKNANHLFIIGMEGYSKEKIVEDALNAHIMSKHVAFSFTGRVCFNGFKWQIQSRLTAAIVSACKVYWNTLEHVQYTQQDLCQCGHPTSQFIVATIDENGNVNK